MLELLDDYWAEITLRDYVCSNCWGHLQKWPVKRSQMWRVLCHRCGDETKGYVTRYFAEGRRDESFGERLETKEMLKSMGIIPDDRSGKSPDELLKEMGF